MNKEDKDIKWAKWLEEEYLQATSVEQDAISKDMKIILDHIGFIVPPVMEEEYALKSIHETIQKSKPTTRYVTLRKVLKGMAASFLILLVSTLLINIYIGNEQIVETDFVNQTNHILEDGSSISLNSKSKITYDNDFMGNRELSLEGEAFFTVKKGSKFTVNTTLGNVEVLGTSFNVYLRNDVFMVSCKTGKVKVKSLSQEFILKPGEQVRMFKDLPTIKHYIDTALIGHWMTGESYFVSQPLIDVTNSLNAYFGVEIILPARYTNQLFTGSFVHDDFNKAIKMVFLPMNIRYRLDNKTKLIIYED